MSSTTPELRFELWLRTPSSVSSTISWKRGSIVIALILRQSIVACCACRVAYGRELFLVVLFISIVRRFKWNTTELRLGSPPSAHELSSRLRLLQGWSSYVHKLDAIFVEFPKKKPQRAFLKFSIKKQNVRRRYMAYSTAYTALAINVSCTLFKYSTFFRSDGGVKWHCFKRHGNFDGFLFLSVVIFKCNLSASFLNWLTKRNSCGEKEWHFTVFTLFGRHFWDRFFISDNRPPPKKKKILKKAHKKKIGQRLSFSVIVRFSNLSLRCPQAEMSIPLRIDILHPFHFWSILLRC